MGEHEVPTIESDDSVAHTIEELAEILASILVAAQEHIPLNLAGVQYLPADDIRRLRYLLKQTNKTVGKQGETIHRLRAEIAEVRQLNSRLDRGDLRYMDNRVHGLEILLASAREEISQLNEKLTAEREIVNDVAEAIEDEDE
jgi:uncharacterized coiled-coil protein SlyX